MIIDLDSHLREQYFLDEIYRLDGPYAQFTPTRIGSGKYQQSNFDHSIDPRPRKAMAVFDHRYMSDLTKNGAAANIRSGKGVVGIWKDVLKTKPWRRSTDKSSFQPILRFPRATTAASASRCAGRTTIGWQT